MEDSLFVTIVKKVFQRNAFSLGFWIGIFLSVGLNFLTYFISCYENATSKFKFSVVAYHAGFPFPFYWEIYANPSRTDFIAIIFAVDVLIGLAFSVATGLIFRFIWMRIGINWLR